LLIFARAAVAISRRTTKGRIAMQVHPRCLFFNRINLLKCGRMCNSRQRDGRASVPNGTGRQIMSKARKSCKSEQPFDPARFFEIAAQGRAISSYPKNEIIFAQGDDADAVFHIKEGRVKLTVSKQSRKAVVGIFGADEFFGEGCLTGQLRRLATATAMTKCVAMRVEKEEFRRVIRDERAFSQIFISHMLAKTARVEEGLVGQLFNSTEKRLARVLLLLANFGKDSRPEPIVAEIEKDTLAEMAGTIRTRVTHFMNKFHDLGFIDYNGKLEVHSSLLNVILADQPSLTRSPM
jgi:CRP/FNR family cyclic AMP-dependent transcriptional regulator